MANSRLIAARIVNDVTDGRSLSDAISKRLKSVKDARERAFVQALCYGVCRFYPRLDVILSHLLKKPMKARDSDVHALLLIGVYQLLYMQTPQHAAVSETVNAAQKLNKSWARGLVNAILRECIRHQDKLDEWLDDEEAAFAHPSWWMMFLKRAWPDEWQRILENNNQHPPFSLRVNTLHVSRDEYLKQLADAGVPAHAIFETRAGIVAEEAVNVLELPGFAKGHVSVQDGAAQLAGELLDVKNGQRVLDACAAPGGKLTHLFEMASELDVVAIEKEADRMALVKDNLQRLQQQANCIVADAGETTWWDGKPFDRILLDAPCSASGVIRRHPDIKLLREPGDIKQLAKLQARILETLWQMLAPGGKLLYATCSVFPAENVEVVSAFLQNHTDAQEEVIDADWGMACDVGRQILPGMHEMDGFYYALLGKKA